MPVAVAEVRLDPRAIDAVLSGQSGPVYRYVFVKADRVKARSQQAIALGKGPRHLRDSLVKRFGRDARGFYFMLEAGVPHALLYYTGTRAHVIVPKKAAVLRFTNRQGAVVFTTRVRHPGTKGHDYLVRPAEQEGFRVRTLVRPRVGVGA